MRAALRVVFSLGIACAWLISTRIGIISADLGDEPPAPVITATVALESEPLTHTIEAGDMLGAIAAQHDTSVQALMAVNGIIDPRLLQIGQVLTIPAAGETPQRVTLTHTIRAGDTLLEIAFEYGSSLTAIEKANPGIDSALLQIGQVVKVPVSVDDIPLMGTSPSMADATPYVIPVDVSASLPDLEAATVAAINAQRAQHGLPPYQFDAELAAVARNHAQDMANRGYFGHVTPEGLTLQDRLSAAGLNSGWVGENYQCNSQPVETTLQTAMAWWMNSSPHRANILHTHYTRLGVGVVELAWGGHVFVLVFGG